jgi:hypothetical protein
MADQKPRHLVSAQGLAAILDIKVARVRSLYREGRLPGYLVGKKDLRFDVDECLSRLRADAAETTTPAQEGSVA